MFRETLRSLTSSEQRERERVSDRPEIHARVQGMERSARRSGFRVMVARTANVKFAKTANVLTATKKTANANCAKGGRSLKKSWNKWKRTKRNMMRQLKTWCVKQHSLLDAPRLQLPHHILVFISAFSSAGAFSGGVAAF